MVTYRLTLEKVNSVAFGLDQVRLEIFTLKRSPPNRQYAELNCCCSSSKWRPAGCILRDDSIDNELSDDRDCVDYVTTTQTPKGGREPGG